jgi:hypothetical protein
MLEGLEPSVELTGGAWYIDGELDTGLIHHLSEACLKVIREMVCYIYMMGARKNLNLFTEFSKTPARQRRGHISYI